MRSGAGASVGKGILGGVGLGWKPARSFLWVVGRAHPGSVLVGVFARRAVKPPFARFTSDLRLPGSFATLLDGRCAEVDGFVAGVPVGQGS